MSHQTGITADKELEQFFSVCKIKEVRTLAISIEDEQLVRHSWSSAVGNWEDDYNSQVIPLLEEKTPRYILFRLDASQKKGLSTQLSDEWLMLLWSPEDSPVRHKMLYASTKATLKRQFGSTQVKDEVFASSKEEATLAAYKRHKQSNAMPAPLTMREEELLEVKRQEVGTDVSVDAKHQTLAGVSFPLTKAAVASLRAFADGKLQYVRLRINLTVEEVDVDDQKTVLNVDQLKGQVPETNARYHLYRYDHHWEGDYLHSVVFVYSCPGYSCPIKERMVYSSSKNPITQYLESNLSLNISKKVEISEASDLTSGFLMDELHPAQCLHRPKFSKPKGPAQRGNRRLTKAPDAD